MFPFRSFVFLSVFFIFYIFFIFLFMFRSLSFCSKDCDPTEFANYYIHETISHGLAKQAFKPFTTLLYKILLKLATKL